ncbi:MAG: hypothetical protein HUU50_03330 [Candidatus Brocadiae bacterium]|nr:hypothetical protein [Candidatus Brocadiia bacterium]
MSIENRIGKVKNTKKGFLMDFSKEKIAQAIINAAHELGGLAKNIDPHSIYTRFRNETDQAIAEALTEDVILCLNMQREYRFPHLPPTLEEIHDIVIDVLQDRGFGSVSAAYSIYREGKNAVRKGWLKEEMFAKNGYPYENMEKRSKWASENGLTSIEEINARIKEGKFLEMVQLDSQRYEKELKQAVSLFEKKSKKKSLRVMIIAGPSSSGKTTTSRKLCSYLREKGHEFKLLAVDNYFFSKEEYPKDWFGDMDYELPESIDLFRLNEDLKSLMEGKTIYPPHYDFAKGTRIETKEPFVLKEKEILLLDCLHGLYPPTTCGLDDDLKFKVYIETQPNLIIDGDTKVKFTDVRLLRRMCRDVRERGYSVQYTLEHWATVRKGEFKGIIPFQKTADVMINGSVIHELPTLKYYLMHNCHSPFDEKILEAYRAKGRMDVYRRGYRAKKLLEKIEEPKREEIEAIPLDNVIREFIGGQKLRD